MSTWFITGSSRGFGLEIARRALDEGHAMVATARRPDMVTDALGRSDALCALPMDVTDPAAIHTAVKAAVDRFGGIDVLVNNAGGALFGALEELERQQIHALFELNVFGLIEVTKAVLPVMRAQGAGRVVNIGSKAGLVGNPGATIYSATKFAVEGISEGLRRELAPFGVQVMAVEPGLFRTDLFDGSSLRTAAEPMTQYAGTPAHATVTWAGEINHAQLGDPVKCATLIYEAATVATMPAHLVIGADALTEWEAKTAAMRADVDTWRERSLATAFD